MHGRRMMMMVLLTMACGAACADGRSGQSPATDTADASYPRFVSGTYELVLDRHEPLFDDSLAVRDLVDRRLTGAIWAQDWRDSLRVLASSYGEAVERTIQDRPMATAADSAEVLRQKFKWLQCEEWQAGGRVILEADGRFTQQVDYREYCGGKLPTFTRRVVTADPDTLGACAWKPPVPATVPHLSCQSGKWHPNYGYSYAGDTLTLSSDCDGSETYVLRLPDPSGQYAVRKSSDLSRLEEC